MLDIMVSADNTQIVIKENRIGGVIVSVLALSAVDRGSSPGQVKPWVVDWGSSPYQVKPWVQ